MLLMQRYLHVDSKSAGKAERSLLKFLTESKIVLFMTKPSLRKDAQFATPSRDFFVTCRGKINCIGLYEADIAMSS
jgi:hypothetical protein